MAKLKWVGIIKEDIGGYQKGDLPANASKLNVPEDMDELMVKSIPFCGVGIAILVVSMFVKTILNKQVVVNPLFVVIGFVAGFLALIIHEYLHGVVYPKGATVYIGIYPKAFAAVALASYPLKRWRFILMCLLPTILGIIPIAAFLILPPYMKALNGFLLGFSMVGLTSPSVDLYNVYQVLKQTPKKCMIQFYGDETYYIN